MSLTEKYITLTHKIRFFLEGFIQLVSDVSFDSLQDGLKSSSTSWLVEL